VSGAAVADAQNALTQLGLQVQVQEIVNLGGGHVFEQSIAPGTLVAPGSSITIAVFP
jgi:beta-lactam-binding protein with PASTA domain